MLHLVAFLDLTTLENEISQTMISILKPSILSIMHLIPGRSR